MQVSNSLSIYLYARMMETRPITRTGFTLIELSIVLVIIGLIIGGVLVGQDLIAAAKIRSVISDQEKYVTAVYAFKNKYNGLPGDLRNAENFWGSDASCPGTPVDTTPKTATCNGDGNGIISTHFTPWDDFKESYRLWQQLGNASLIPGLYTGTSSGSVGNQVIGQNVPASRLTGASFFIAAPNNYGVNGPISWLYFPGMYGNSLWLGSPVNNVLNIWPAFSAIIALQIDTRIDDGLPGTGRIVTFKQGNGYTVSNCATTNNEATARYDLTRTTAECILIFRNLF